MLKVEEYVDISSYCTLQIGGQFRYFIYVKNIDDIKEAQKLSKIYNLPLRIIGSGSNMVFPDGVLENIVVKMEISGFEIINEDEDHVDIKIGAGENWDSVVERTVSMNLSGIEALSVIPGTSGATPVQNVGAYGQEIKNTLLSVEVLDMKNGNVKSLSNADCKFSYRDSIFKNEARGKYVIISIILRLSRSKPTIPNYPGVKKYFEERNITDPSLKEIREAIIFIRSNKLPDPKVIPNVGSFFKNPIVPNSIADKLKTEYPNLTVFPINDQLTKVPAGFLIETAGLKDKSFGKVSTYKNNALVLVNNGGATRSDIENTKNTIVKTVKDKFNITLEAEPEFV